MAPAVEAATTLNPSGAGAGISFSNGNLTASMSSTASVGAVSTTSKSSGKYYFEVTIGATANYYELGIGNSSYSTSANPGSANSAGYGSNGFLNVNSGQCSGTFATYGSGAVIGIAVDVTNALLYVALNNTYQNSSNPVSGTGGCSLGISPPYFAALGFFAGSQSANFTVNFGNTAFVYSPPTGFSRWDLLATSTPFILNPAVVP